MPFKFEEPKSHLTSYHVNNNLVMQFMLFELIAAHEEATGVIILSENLPPKPKSQHLQEITATLLRMAGHGQQSLRIFSWHLNDGILSKLKNYCFFFSNSQDPNESEINTLLKHIDRTINYCIEGIEQIDQKDISEFHSKMKKMEQALQKTARGIIKFLPPFYQDENVIFFLLRSREKLNNIYGDRFIANLFKEMFPQGPEKAKQLLIKKYSKRGFQHLLPMIISHISALELTQKL